MSYEGSLNQVKARLSEETFSGHELLKKSGVIIPDRLVLAELALLVSEFGDEAKSEIGIAAIGLELMQLAVDLHYRTFGGDSHLRLIAADYYYARAIKLASGFRSVRTVAALSRAIADISLAEADMAAGKVDNACLIPRKRAALFAAAGEIGADLAGLSEDAVEALTLFGRRSGVVFVTARGIIPNNLCKGLPPLSALVDEASEGLEALGSLSTVQKLTAFIAELAEG